MLFRSNITTLNVTGALNMGTTGAAIPISFPASTTAHAAFCIANVSGTTDVLEIANGAPGSCTLTPITFDNAGNIHSPASVDAVNGYKVNGTAGFSGTKTAGTCVLTIQSGIITNVTGC